LQSDAVPRDRRCAGKSGPPTTTGSRADARITRAFWRGGGYTARAFVVEAMKMENGAACIAVRVMAHVRHRSTGASSRKSTMADAGARSGVPAGPVEVGPCDGLQNEPGGVPVEEKVAFVVGLRRRASGHRGGARSLTALQMA
jgi:hypothetical protein